MCLWYKVRLQYDFLSQSGTKKKYYIFLFVKEFLDGLMCFERGLFVYTFFFSFISESIVDSEKLNDVGISLLQVGAHCCFI